jgi:hypothetical protein
VLEHVVHNRKAMNGLYRVAKSRSWAVLGRERPVALGRNGAVAAELGERPS